MRRQSPRQLAAMLEAKLANIMPSHITRVTHTAHEIKLSVIAGGKVHEFAESKSLGVMGVDSLVRQATSVYLDNKYEAAK